MSVAKNGSLRPGSRHSSFDPTSSMLLELSATGLRKRDKDSAPVRASPSTAESNDMPNSLKQLHGRYQEIKKADAVLQRERQQWMLSIEKWIVQQHKLIKQCNDPAAMQNAWPMQRAQRDSPMRSESTGSFESLASRVLSRCPTEKEGQSDNGDDCWIADEDDLEARNILLTNRKVGSEGATGGGGVWSGTGVVKNSVQSKGHPHSTNTASNISSVNARGDGELRERGSLQDQVNRSSLDSMGSKICEMDRAFASVTKEEEDMMGGKSTGRSDADSSTAPAFRMSRFSIRNWQQSRQTGSFDDLALKRGSGDRKKTSKPRRAITSHRDLVWKEQSWWLRTLVTSQYFDTCVAMLIIFNALMIGAEVEYMARDPEGQTLHVFLVAQYIFSFIFLIELTLRLVVFRLTFFTSKTDWAWNLFDLALVMLSLVEMIVAIVEPQVLQESFVNISAQRVIRVLRVVRNVRMVRVMRFFREFRMMVYAILGSVKTLLWLMILLFLVLYFFALCFTQGTIEFLLSQEVGAPSIQAGLLEEHYSTMPRSMFSLFKAMTSGVNWGVIVRPLAELHWIYVWLFVLFISFAIFCVLNAVTGVFVDSAMQTTQHEQDLAIQSEMCNREKYVKQLRVIFEEMDYDKSGTITFEEFETCLQDTRMRACLEALGIDTSELGSLFTLLDIDDSGEIEIIEFVSGCMRLKGEAKSVDIAVLMYEHKRMAHRWSSFMQYVQEQFEFLRKQEKKQSARPMSQSAAMEAWRDSLASIGFSIAGSTDHRDSSKMARDENETSSI